MFNPSALYYLRAIEIWQATSYLLMIGSGTMVLAGTAGLLLIILAQLTAALPVRVRASFLLKLFCAYWIDFAQVEFHGAK